MNKCKRGFMNELLFTKRFSDDTVHFSLIKTQFWNVL